MGPRNPYFGCSIGRVCNQITNGEFTIDDQVFSLTKNSRGLHHINGGELGFHTFNWSPYLNKSIVNFKYTIPSKIKVI